jgi:hypothetical protein
MAGWRTPWLPITASIAGDRHDGPDRVDARCVLFSLRHG